MAIEGGYMVVQKLGDHFVVDSRHERGGKAGLATNEVLFQPTRCQPLR